MKIFGGAGASSADLDLHLAQDDQALRSTWDAVHAGQWAAARDLMAATRSDFDRRARYVWVLGESVTSATWARMVPQPLRGTPQVDTTAAWADQWAAAEPGNPDAILVRSRSLIMRGWEVRGSGWAGGVGPAAFEEFHRLLQMAVPLCHEAAELAPDDPTPWAQLLLLATALGAGRDAFEQLWAEVVARDPLHREAHNFKLMYLCEKWRGSHAEMFGFARQAAASAPHGSPLHVLPVQASAEWALWELDRERGRFGEVREARRSPAFQAELDGALNAWFTSSPRKHAMWYHDLNHLAHGLHHAKRHADAKAVFEAIGPYMEDIPWAWDGTTAKQSFRAARKKALRA